MHCWPAFRKKTYYNCYAIAATRKICCVVRGSRFSRSLRRHQVLFANGRYSKGGYSIEFILGENFHEATMSQLYSCLCSWYCLICLSLYFVHKGLSVPVIISPEHEHQNKTTASGDPVWSHGESYSYASASGEGAMVETDSWTSIDNNGGLQVNNVTSNGTVVGYQVLGLTNCSQESWALATGALFANAVAHGLCNSSVLLDQPVSNTGVGGNATST